MFSRYHQLVAPSRSTRALNLSRRQFLTTALAGAAGLALYSGEVARHLIEITEPEIRLPNLPTAFDGLRIAQLSDIHLDEFTEPFFLRMAIERINRLRPDVVLLTGDFVTREFLPKSFPMRAASRCASILQSLECTKRYAVLGNHDVSVRAPAVIDALSHSVTVLRNSFAALERGSSRIWLAGLDDVIEGRPNLDRAVPEFIRQRSDEPVVLLCHEPDFVDYVLPHAAGPSVNLMLSGHTHGGQVRLPVLGPLALPDWGKKYVEGIFRFGNLQLYVNRGIGTVGLPFRLNCTPEITLMTLRRA